MKSVASLSYSNRPITDFYSEPVENNPHPHTLFLYYNFNIILP
jgi:hypothetical protein